MWKNEPKCYNISVFDPLELFIGIDLKTLKNEILLFYVLLTHYPQWNTWNVHCVLKTKVNRFTSLVSVVEIHKVYL